MHDADTITKAWMQLPVNDGPNAWHLLENPSESFTAWTYDQVTKAISLAQQWAANGSYVCGYVSYDAAPTFDSGLSSQLGTHPLANFSAFQTTGPTALPTKSLTQEAFDLKSNISQGSYLEHIEVIAELIAKGDTYQTNFCYQLEGTSPATPENIFYSLAAAQPTQYACYLESDNLAVSCVSPELFFSHSNNALTMKPMKGTSPRSANQAQDVALAQALQTDPKERAENIMICDMARNDMSKLATGRCETTNLCSVETHPTLHQMTSTVTCNSKATLAETFEALFPAASIVGAPKYSTSKIIHDLEQAPRGIYCGAIGYVTPEQSATFAVAIRTLVTDRKSNQVSYGVGGGIVADSVAAKEWQETQTKAAVLANVGSNG